MTENQHKMRNIVLRDLETLLRQKLGDELIVKNYSTEPLLPPGENYGSTILRVDAVIKKNESADEEDLHLVAKMPPPTEFQLRVFDSPYTFKKEIFMYEGIVPSYNRIEMELGIPHDQVFNVLAKYYGSRLTLDPSVDFNDDAVILMENLKARGYYTGKRYIGYDLEHSRLALQAAARFHALGVTIKQKKADYFEVLKKKSKSINIAIKEFEDAMEPFKAKMKEDPVIKDYYPRCLEAFTLPTSTDLSIPPKEPWSSIVHSDFWVNNILFHRDENNRVDDVKFVDFQNYLFLSPLRELVFYIYTSTDKNVRDNHVDELIDLYYETFISTLTRLKCNIEEYTRDKFDAQLPIDAQIEFGHLCFMLKVMTLNAKELEFDYDKMENVMKEYQGNAAYDDRLREVVLEFAKRKWI